MRFYPEWIKKNEDGDEPNDLKSFCKLKNSDVEKVESLPMIMGYFV